MTLLLPLLLASASPRRRQLISSLGLPFTVCASPVDEDAIQASYEGPLAETAKWTAEHKATAALTLTEATNRLIIAADTTVLLDNEILGKPRDTAHARALLLALRGRWHHVITGVVACTMISGKLHLSSASCTTPVLMRPYSEEEIDAYIATGDPMDKAGAYGIQHTQFQPTERIDGCFLNVVGLPLCVLTTLLAQFNIPPTEEGRKNTPCRWSEHCLL
ncbi:MAG: Maf family protein [Ktedonobacteraceae bacterium]